MMQNFCGWVPFVDKFSEDSRLVIIDSNGTMCSHVVKILRLQANPRKQQKYLPQKFPNIR